MIQAALLEKVKSYEMPPKAVELMSKNPPLIIAGVTAAGKDTTMKEIAENSEYREVITHTTRPPRPGEQNGVNYWYVSEEEMLNLLDAGLMIEAKAIHGETVYGTSIAAYENVLRQGFKPVLIIEVQGIEEITKKVPSVRPIFILPPSFEEWMHRLDGRGVMSHAEKKKRLVSARMELEAALRSHHFSLVVNHNYEDTARKALMANPEATNQMQNRELIKMLLERIATY